MTALYEDHYSSLVRLAALLVGDMAAAQEIVQDSFVALCHARCARWATGRDGAPEYPAVISALRALPARQRAVLVLRYYADLSEAQVAEVMGISKGAVGRHTERATASLRAVLDGEHE